MTKSLERTSLVSTSNEKVVELITLFDSLLYDSRLQLVAVTGLPSFVYLEDKSIVTLYLFVVPEFELRAI